MLKTTYRLVSMAMALLLSVALPAASCQAADSAAPAAAGAAPASAESGLTAPGGYRAYRQSHAGQPAGTTPFTLEAAAFTANPGESAARLEEYKGERAVVMVADEADALHYTLTVPQTGRYTVTVRYYPIKSNERPIEIGLRLDGDYPFDGAERFSLNRVFRNESTAIPRDAQGNEYAPRQVEYFAWFDAMLGLMDGTVDEPVELYLEAGIHELVLETLAEPYALKSLTFAPVTEPPSYADYRAQHADAGGRDAIRIEAELADRKSDQSLRPASDRTSPLTSPYHPSKVRMNILSSNWAAPGQWLEWEFDAPSDGYYALGFRYQQYYNINFFVTRKLYLDGEVPYREAADLRFDYTMDWRFVTLSAVDGQPLSLYLTKGRHTIRMEAVLGAYAALLDRLDETVAALNDLYRQIIMITSVSPDKYQDYYLDREIPGLTDTLRAGADTLQAMYAQVKDITRSEGAQAAILNVFASQLTSFLQDPETIPLRIGEFKNNVGSLAAWVLDLKSQPMDFDYLYLYQAEAPVPKAKADFFDTLVHECRSFAASFTEDYNAMGSTAEGESIDVWVGSGRDQAQIIRMMVNDLYTPRHHIGVNLKLVSAGMVEAFLSGQTPDVALSIGRGQPLNLAVRGALADLSQFDDFDTVKDWFLPTALDPYYFENGCFGLPDTQSFYMLFYRTDIFEQLSIQVPQTWEDFYAVIPEIQRFNMEVGVPYTSVDAFGAADAGMGVRNIFPALLFQHGGSFYNAAGSGTALGTAEAVEAFRQWCRLYKDYGIQLSYDFYNRFRTGEVPLGIAAYTEYARLESAAPEIRGLWEMVPIPGTRREDGRIDRAQAGSGTACVILSNTAKREAAWDFLRWYCGAEAQTRYAKDVEAQMGLLARVAVANTEALSSLAWTKEQLDSILTQRADVREIPEVLGGYYLIRGLDNAFRDVVYEGKNPKESLKLYDKQINGEIQRKREEFGLG